MKFTWYKTLLYRLYKKAFKIQIQFQFAMCIHRRTTNQTKRQTKSIKNKLLQIFKSCYQLIDILQSLYWRCYGSCHSNKVPEGTHASAKLKVGPLNRAKRIIIANSERRPKQAHLSGSEGSTGSQITNSCDEMSQHFENIFLFIIGIYKLWNLNAHRDQFAAAQV